MKRPPKIARRKTPKRKPRPPQTPSRPGAGTPSSSAPPAPPRPSDLPGLAAAPCLRPARPGEGITINKLAERTGLDRQTVKRELERAGLAPIMEQGLGNRSAAIYEAEPAQALLTRFLARKTEKGEAEAENPWRREVMARAEKLERENRIAERLENETYMLTEDVEQVVSLFNKQLDQVQVKMESEQGLAAGPARRLQELLDEARREMAAGLLGLGDEQTHPT